MAQSHYTYIGSGDIYLREAGSAAGLTKIGVISKLDLSAEEEAKSLRGGRGNPVVNEIRRVSGVTAVFTLHGFNKADLAIALRGAGATVAAASITGEEHVAYKGALIRLARVNPSTVVVKNEAGTTTYVAGTDYTVSPGGVHITDASSIVNGDTVQIDYAHGEEDVIEAFVNSGKEFEMYFDGINEADSGKAVTVDFYRFKPGVLKSLPLFGEDFAAFEIEGALLADASKAAGTSQYFRINQQV
jgi:hypothetical protein